MLAALNPTVNFIGFGLIVVGAALLIATLAFWRSAIEDPQVLGPLEMMGERRYSKANDFERFEILNDVRPGGPMPVLITTAPPPPQQRTSESNHRRRRGRARIAEGIAPASEPAEDWNGDDVRDEGWHDEGTSPSPPDSSGPVIDPLLQFQNNKNHD